MYDTQNRVERLQLKCSLRFEALFSTRGGPFRLLLPYRARLPRPHPGRACAVACSRARAAGVSAEVGLTG